MLKKGAKVNVSDINGRTPLYFAALANNYYDVVALVEEGGGDMYKRDCQKKGPIDVVKSNDILKYFFSKMKSQDLLKYDPKVELYDEVVAKHPAVIEPFLNIFIESEQKDLDAHDNRLKFDLSLFATGDKRTQFNMMHRHIKLIDNNHFDMLLHPVMRGFTDLKWMQFLWLFVGVVVAVFLFLVSFTFHGFRYVDYCQCQPLDLKTFEPFEGEDSLGESVCGKGINGVIVCTDRNDLTVNLSLQDEFNGSVLFCQNDLKMCK